MKKERISIDQLAVISYFVFGKLDSTDVTLLMNEISDITEVVLEDDLDKYFITADGMIILDSKYIQSLYQNVDEELFESIQMTKAYKRLNSIDMSKFVLNKIKMLDAGCVVEDVSTIFGFSQLCVMNELYQKGYIIDYWHEEAIYDDYRAIKLTKRGDLYLFLIDNKKEINQFIEELRMNGYNDQLLEAFLIVQDLERDLNEILTLDEFVRFCSDYDRCPFAGNSKKSEYSRALR